MKNITQALKVIALALTLSFGISYVYAWTAPTVTPPGGNVSAPINTSSTAQYKEGALGIGGLLRGYTNAIFDGNVGVGTTGPQGRLEVNNRNTATGAALFIAGGEDDLSPVAGQYTGINFGYGGAANYNGGGIFYEFTDANANGKLEFAVKSLSGVGTANLSDTKMTILNSGNIGIGTTNPTQKLDVAGNIKGTGLCIGTDCKTSWPTGGVTPPAGSEFLDTSATAQTKAGDFTVGGILSGANATFSRIGIGAAVDPSASLNVAGTIKTTGFQLATGAGSGKVLTSDSLGNTSWTDPVQATGGGGGGFLEEVIYVTPGTYDFVVPSWMNRIGVQLYSAGGGGSSPWYKYAGWVGGTSSFGPSGAPIISATGGAGGSTVAGAKGVANTAHISIFSVSAGGYGGGGAPGYYLDEWCEGSVAQCSTYGKTGGQGALAKGIFSVTPGQTMKLIVGAGGAGGCDWSGCGGRGNPGYVYLTYLPAPALANSQTFASNGTFTVPAGVTSITVEVWGGGGAGGSGGASQNYTGYWTYTAGGGGGSGGYAKSTFAVTPGATYAVVVGAGGSSGTQTGFYVDGGQSGRNNEQGKPGAPSSFGTGGTYTSATGGTGGVSFDTYCGGGSCNGNISCGAGWQAPAGTATNGNFLNTTGSVGSVCNVGTGGASVGGKSFGAGGNGGASGATTTNYPGSDGAVVVSW